MDEYQKEIQELQEQVDAMVEAEGDAETIRDLSMQIDVLQAIYHQATELWEKGRGDAPLRSALAMRGYGEWTLDNVYAFVYESSIEFPAEGHHAFVTDIREADFAAQLATVGGAELN